MTLKPAGFLLGAVLVVSACGGVMDDASGQEASPRSSTTTDTQAAPLYPEYNPDIHCQVWSQYVPCNDGIYMFAYWSDDWGYYIERDVCIGRHGGPYICPW